MSSTRTMGISITDVGTDQLLPLGFEYREPASGDDQGEKTWIYVKNAESSTSLVEGTLAMRDLAVSTYAVNVSSGAISPQRIVGVAQHTIAAGSYGFIQRKGVGQILCDGTVTVDLAQVPDATAGQATDVGAVTGAGFGIALATDAGAGTKVACLLQCVG